MGKNIAVSSSQLEHCSQTRQRWNLHRQTLMAEFNWQHLGVPWATPRFQLLVFVIFGPRDSCLPFSALWYHPKCSQRHTSDVARTSGCVDLFHGYAKDRQINSLLWHKYAREMMHLHAVYNWVYLLLTIFRRYNVQTCKVQHVVLPRHLKRHSAGGVLLIGQLNVFAVHWAFSWGTSLFSERMVSFYIYMRCYFGSNVNLFTCFTIVNRTENSPCVWTCTTFHCCTQTPTLPWGPSRATGELMWLEISWEK